MGFRSCSREITWLMFLILSTKLAHADGNIAADGAWKSLAQPVREFILSEIEGKQIPALSIAVVAGGEVVWAEGFGFQDAERTIPATASTVYRAGSVSKLFTAVAAMQLAERGLLDLDAPIRDVLPDFQPHNPFEIAPTVRQLLAHQSGLCRESPVGNYFDPDEPSQRRTVASLNQTTLVYPPGQRTKYSNAGLAVVGQIIEQLSRRPFAEQVHADILQPLGCQRSSFVLNETIAAHRAHAEMWTYDHRRHPAPQFALGTLAAGNLYSTVLDLARFAQAVMREGAVGEGRLLKAASLAEMLAAAPLPDGTPSPYGVGFRLGSFEGRQLASHGGAVYGFATQWLTLPDDDVAVIVMASLDCANGFVTRLAEATLSGVLAIQNGRTPQAPVVSSPVPAELIRSLAGRYSADERRLHLEPDGDRLFLWRDSDRVEIRAAVDDFVVDDVQAYGPKLVRLDADTIQVGDVRYTRLEDSCPPNPPARWEGLIGEYGWDHNTLYIRERDGRLMALIEWFFDYPLTELSDDEFAFPDFGMYHGEKLKFTRDAGGQATRVVAAEVTFARRAVGTAAGETFRIQPLQPIGQLRAQAARMQPPAETGDFRPAELVEVVAMAPEVKLDIRYASTNNFTGEKFYDEARAFLQRPAAEAVAKAHTRLAPWGYGLLIHDAYRPWSVTRMFWDATPDELKQFVANPALGSRHNRGCAVDLTLYDLQTGAAVEMVGGYDEFSPRAYPLYPGGTSRQRWRRALLRSAMEAEGFRVIANEWWHFDYQDWRRYGIQNLPFSEINSGAD